MRRCDEIADEIGNMAMEERHLMELYPQRSASWTRHEYALTQLEKLAERADRIRFR